MQGGGRQVERGREREKGGGRRDKEGKVRKGGGRKEKRRGSLTCTVFPVVSAFSF